jgi:hypothetical protein
LFGFERAIATPQVCGDLPDRSYSKPFLPAANGNLGAGGRRRLRVVMTMALTAITIKWLIELRPWTIRRHHTRSLILAAEDKYGGQEGER